MIDRYRDRAYGDYRRQAEELAEIRGLHEPHNDPAWVPPVLTFPARLMDEAAVYPIDGDAA